MICLLPAAYCLLPTACCLLPTACCLLPAASQVSQGLPRGPVVLFLINVRVKHDVIALSYAWTSQLPKRFEIALADVVDRVVVPPARQWQTYAPAGAPALHLIAVVRPALAPPGR